MEKDHFKQGHLVGPPKRQWTALRPNLVYEHVDGDLGGDKTKIGVAIEWIGINWWDKGSSPIKIPFGVSVASVYSDRAAVDDVGHGLMFHFNNSYSVGWSRRGGDDGFYISIDLLKAVVDKKATFEKYKGLMGDQ